LKAYIQDWVKQQYGFVPKTCWIAHVKHMSGLPMRKAHNRHKKAPSPGAFVTARGLACPGGQSKEPRTD